VPALRAALVPRAEVDLRDVRVPGGSQEDLPVGPEVHHPADDGHRPHALPQDHEPQVQERVQDRRRGQEEVRHCLERGALKKKNPNSSFNPYCQERFLFLLFALFLFFFLLFDFDFDFDFSIILVNHNFGGGAR
jgi:hypothetical protein